MNSKIDPAQSAASGGEIVKYTLAALLVLGGLFVWFWFSSPEHAARLGEWSTPLRGLAVVAGLAAGLMVFLTSVRGHDLREFVAESRFELRKVVWPTRQETTRMTWVVIAVVVLLSLILAGFDFVVKWAIELFLNLGR
ncbi:preprotein translocase subunit SecE [Pseudoxanthomonas broegbernensis]|uniref:Protein translocase subunit SecE n=1 Tax=Pseudoxanthomonas broegbernensis TaxID=83619 RepID=A0A7V8K6X6_9GAMM|nr:preprotein translocase subunit SecE [Pseudoxanthomonas broegbernensis]KAF1686412.1 preprotein translocase subunit SecE [Pseudoxanthomonas broegbernensis]MBB6064339.1 preprotein translocase subunit SecE [Pseudoxanthomonas broegbernensis]